MVLLSYSGIAQKTACYLLMQARQSGKPVVRVPGSVTNWAMVMNVSRSSLHRELKKLEADGILSYTLPTIEILDPDALQKCIEQIALLFCKTVSLPRGAAFVLALSKPPGERQAGDIVFAPRRYAARLAGDMVLASG